MLEHQISFLKQPIFFERPSIFIGTLGIFFGLLGWAALILVIAWVWDTIAGLLASLWRRWSERTKEADQSPLRRIEHI